MALNPARARKGRDDGAARGRSTGHPGRNGVATDAESLLTWEDVASQLEAAKLFWIATSGPGGQARVRPVDGTWFEGAIYCGGSPRTRWVRDLLANPQVSAHLDSTDGVVIVEGTAQGHGGGIRRCRGTARGSPA